MVEHVAAAHSDAHVALASMDEHVSSALANTQAAQCMVNVVAAPVFQFLQVPQVPVGKNVVVIHPAQFVESTSCRHKSLCDSLWPCGP